MKILLFLVLSLTLFGAPITSVKSDTATIEKTKLEFTLIHSSKELNELIKANSGKKIMLDFYADWCTSCKKLDETTFKDSDVIQSMNGYLLLRADLSVYTPEMKELTKRFGLFGPPAMIFFDTDGRKIEGKEIIGFKGVPDFLNHVKDLGL